MARQELLVIVEQCLAELSDAYREVIERCIINGERASAVAADLGRSVQAIYNLIDRAKRQLLRLLEAKQIRFEDLATV